MTVLITVVVLVAALIILSARVFVKALIDQYARSRIEPLVSRSAISARHRAARRVARQGDAPGLVLAIAAASEGRQAYEELQQRVAPTPEVAALLAATSAEGSPFASRRALLIALGAGADRDIMATLAHAGQRTVAGAFLIGSRPNPRLADEVVRVKGDLWEQLDAAAQWADEQLAQGAGDFVAVLLRTPVTGDWDDDADFDLDRLVKALLKPDADLWLVVSDPGDPSAWPAEVVVTLPASVRTVWRALRRHELPRPPRKARLDRYTVRLAAADAAALIVAITAPGARVERAPVGTTTAQRYGATVTLALTPDAREGRASVLPDDGALRAAEDFLNATGVRITSRLHGTERRLSLAIYPSRTVAWRLKSLPESKVTPSIMSSEYKEASQPEIYGNRAKAWLQAAIESNDESVAAAVLATHGRAWIEEAQSESALQLISQVEKAFEIGSRAGLWARYLLALDSALRCGNADSKWFTEEICTLADRTELGLLFWTERAEFMRLRGDIAGACTAASAILTRISMTESPVDTGGVYAVATSRYVTANLLRQGGQYELARELIETATAQYDPDVPSHRLELTHCLYGRSVCNAMRGLAVVVAGNGWTSDEAVFAQSLVTLANSHAAWFVADYDRAIQFAESAREGFARIGYQRYAGRALRLVNLLDDWSRRSGRLRSSRPTHNVDIKVQELLSAAPGSRVTALANERPSRALSILQFALAYGSEPQASRKVELPQYIAAVSPERLVPVTLPPAPSYREADKMLRGILGVGAATPVPLAVD